MFLETSVNRYAFTSLLAFCVFARAKFTLKDLYKRKCSLNLKGGLVPLLPALKFQKQASSSGEEIEKAYSDTDLNTLVGSSENYFVKEMQPVDSLLHELRSYQKQVLFWMSKMEKEKQMKEAMKSIHPYWDAYKISARFTSSLLLTTSLLPLIVAIGLLQQQLLHLKCCYRRI